MCRYIQANYFYIGKDQQHGYGRKARAALRPVAWSLMESPAIKDVIRKHGDKSKCARNAASAFCISASFCQKNKDAVCGRRRQGVFRDMACGLL